MAPLVHVAVASLTLVLVKTLVELLSERLRSPLENLPGPPPLSWLRGHMDQLFHPQGWDFHLKTVAAFGTAVRLRGFLGEDVLYLTDPAGLRTILTGEHGDIYEEPPMITIIEKNKLLWGPGLLSSTGMAHKKQRRVLDANAVFSVQRMRTVMPIFWDVTRRLEDTMVNLLQCGSTELDMLIWMSRVSLELIGQAGIGVSFDTLSETSLPSEHVLTAKQLIPLSFPLQGFMRLVPSIVKIGPPKFCGFQDGIVPYPNIRKLRENNGACEGTGRDIISVLIQQNKGADPMDKVSDDELISQTGTLIFGGHETTLVALSRILHVLSLRPKSQERLRLEVMGARVERRDISYDDLMKLPYLDAVCKETLRLYAPVTQLHRVPRRNSIIPLSRPVLGRDGQMIDCIQVQAGTMVVLGTAAVNRDPAIWGLDADQWVPERWLQPLPETVVDAYLPGVLSHMMTFMGGGRSESCIGIKLAEVEIKAVLYVLLSRMKFGPSGAPITWDMHNFATPTVQGGNKPSMPLKVTLLSG
ncbi:cytochrome P450 [Russula ochroleuca]|uniref:Cytochrome P450 n=1 Tax=Russula ochroleuca TaxID=152965 RepID=A0A9P5TBA2_9AGAM|nr:cytochrome P450 [Russula ochroleuca]